MYTCSALRYCSFLCVSKNTNVFTWMILVLALVHGGAAVALASNAIPAFTLLCVPFISFIDFVSVKRSQQLKLLGSDYRKYEIENL